jgi:hypothetical protein
MQSKSDLMIDSCYMTEIWNAHLYASHDLRACDPCHDGAYFYQKSCDYHDPCPISENACLPNNCVDDYHDDIHHIACDHDVCDHDNALVSFDEHRSMRASGDRGLLWSALSCDQYLNLLSSCLSSTCLTLH